MATVTGFTAARMLAMEDATVIDGHVAGTDLILVTKGGTEIVAGPVQGPKGDTGIQGVPGTAGEKLTVGMLSDFPKLPLPVGWIHCDGSIRTIVPEEAALAAYLGTTFGGDGITTYGLPNYRGRVRVALDGGDPQLDTAGEMGGEAKHILTTAEMPIHNHPSTLAAPQHTHSVNHYHTSDNQGFFTDGTTGYFDLAITGVGGGLGPVDTHPATSWASHPTSGGATALALTGGIGNAGSGQAHNNMQPYVVVITAIKM